MLALLAFSAFFSGSESALFSLDAVTLRRMRRSGGSGALAARLLRNPDLLLVSILFGNMLVNIFYIVLAASVAQGFSSGTVLAVWGTGTLLALIVLGEVTPKTVAVSSPSFAARLAALPLYFFVRSVGRLVYRPLRGLVRGRSGHAVLKPEDLKYLVELSARRRKITPHEGEMLSDVIALAEIRVKDVMVPSVEVVTVDADAALAEVLDKAGPAGAHFLPVIDNDTDEVMGVVDFVECLARFHEKGADELREPIKPLVKPAVFVPEAARCSSLLERLKDHPDEELLVVVDEYGGFAGVVTDEDLVEAFVGPFRDEFDAAIEFDAEEVSPGVFRVPGDFPVRDWFELMNLEAETVDLPVSTIAGFFIYLTGRLPKEGDEARFGSLRLRASRVEGRRLVELTVETIEEARP